MGDKKKKERSPQESYANDNKTEYLFLEENNIEVKS
jgi:hypothetical protein